LVVCRCCGYAFYGKPVSASSAKGKPRRYAYYRCIGTDAYRFGGERICANQQVRTDLLEEAVWEDVCGLLRNPKRIEHEYQRRLTHDKSTDHDTQQLQGRIQSVKRGIARLVDAYEDGLLEKTEFGPRIRRLRDRLAKLEAEAQAAAEQLQQRAALRMVIGQLEEFARHVEKGLEDSDWAKRREIIRALVKRIEVDQGQIQVVYRIDPPPFDKAPNRGRLQDCWRRSRTTKRKTCVFPGRMKPVMLLPPTNTLAVCPAHGPVSVSRHRARFSGVSAGLSQTSISGDPFCQRYRGLIEAPGRALSARTVRPANQLL
jgi:site-specific DNA recombinase